VVIIIFDHLVASFFNMCLSAITFVCIAGDRGDDDDDDDDMNSCGFNHPHWPVRRSQALGMFFGGACGPEDGHGFPLKLDVEHRGTFTTWAWKMQVFPGFLA
jgi:hypothetical protein